MNADKMVKMRLMFALLFVATMTSVNALDSRWIEVDVPSSAIVTNASVTYQLCEHMRTAMINQFPIYARPFTNVSVTNDALCSVTLHRNKYYYKTFFEADALSWRMIRANLFSRPILTDFVELANIMCGSGFKTDDGLSYKAPTTTCAMSIRPQDCCECQCVCL